MARNKKNETESQEEYLSGFPSKYKKHLNPEWVSKVDAMTDEEIKTCLLAAEGCIMTTESDLDNDLDIQNLKEELKEKEAQYKDIISEAKAKSKYLVHISKDRGKVE